MPTPQALIDLFCKEFKAEPKATKPKAPTVAAKPQPEVVTSKHWTPVALVYHITEQTCRCCGRTSESVGNVLVKHVNPKQHASWECVRADLASHKELPSEFFTHQQQIEKCPSCLRSERILCDFPQSHPHQFTFLTH